MQFLSKGQTSNFDINTSLNEELPIIDREQSIPQGTPPFSSAIAPLTNSEQAAKLMSFWADDSLSPSKTTEQARSLQLPP